MEYILLLFWGNYGGLWLWDNYEDVTGEDNWGKKFGGGGCRIYSVAFLGGLWLWDILGCNWER